MTLKTVIKQITAVLNFPKALGNFIIYARAIFLAMTNNDYFTKSAVDVAQLGADIAILEEIETACYTKPPTRTIEERDVALEVVKMGLRSLRNDVQNVANANPRLAKAIIASAAMDVKNSGTHGKQQNTATNGIEKGSVDLTAEVAGVHSWRLSLDGINWTLSEPSFTSKQTIKNLASNTVYYFQNCWLGPNDVVSEWSQSVKITTN